MAGLFFPRWRARRRYFAAQEAAGPAWAEFTYRGGDARSRVDGLRWIASCERTMSNAAFGFESSHADERDGDGFTVGQSHGLAALLAGVLADTEVVANGLHTSMARWVSGRRSNLVDDPAVAAVLSKLSTETGLAHRAELTLALSDAVLERVGGQAAEVLSEIACGYFVLSGMSLDDATLRVGWERPPDSAAAMRTPTTPHP